MAVLATTQGLISLPSRALVGRSSSCVVAFEDRTVSGEHAVFVYARGLWSVRDLGSRNGTRVDGVVVRSGESVGVKKGSAIDVGSVTVTLLSDGPPGPAVVSENGAVIDSSGGVLPLSQSDSPSSFLVENSPTWCIESADGVRSVADGDLVLVDGKPWTLFLPTLEAADVRSTVKPMDSPLLVTRITLEFFTSAGEDLVELVIKNTEHRVPARVSNYLLLLLARARLADNTTAQEDRGWVSSNELAKQLSFDLERLNLEVYRARFSLASLGVADASRIIERRAVTRQLRIGTERIVLPPHES